MKLISGYKDVKFKGLNVREKMVSGINWPVQEVWMNSVLHFIVCTLV